MQLNKKLYIVLERDPATELAARILRREHQEGTTSLCRKGPCFLCGEPSSKTLRRGHGHHHGIVAEVFAKCAEEFGGSNYNWRGETCVSCFDLMEKVWTLHKQIASIREEMKILVERACGFSFGRVPEVSSVKQRKRRRFSSPCRPPEEPCIIIKQESDTDEENFNSSLGSPLFFNPTPPSENFPILDENDGIVEEPVAVPASSPRRLCRVFKIMQDKDVGMEEANRNWEIEEVMETEAIAPGPSQRPLRKSRAKAESLLKGAQNEGGGSGDESEDFEPPADDTDSEESDEGCILKELLLASEAGAVLSCPQPECQFKTANKSQFETHSKHAHNGRKKKTPRISEGLSKVGDNVKCNVCQKMFNVHNDARKHWERVHKKKINFTCSYCDQGYYQKVGLRRHIRSQHFQQNDEIEKISEKTETLVASLNIARDGMSWKCLHDNCGKVLKLARYAIEHVENVHLKKRRFICDMCGDGFYFSGDYHRHKREKHGAPDRPCRSCGKIFTRERYRIEHEVTVCRLEVPAEEIAKYNIKILHCNYEGCNRMYANPGYLERHILRLHQEEKAFKCSFCEKRFKVDDTRKTHEKNTHLEPGKRYPCEHCELSYRSKSDREHHTRVIHLNEPKDVVCDTCGASFYHIAGLRTHRLRVHETLVTCGKCGKMMDAFSLKKHQKSGPCSVRKRKLVDNADAKEGE